MVWKHVEVLSTGLAVLLNVAAGVIIGGLKLLPDNAYGIINGAVFKVFLPALVCRGIGLRTDLYEDNIWRFIGAFLILRAIALAVAAATHAMDMRVWRGDRWRELPSRIVVDWLGMAWISTVILGVPVLQAAIGDPAAKYGILAGISSFVFQLPLMLILLEVHRWLNVALPMTRNEGVAHGTPANGTVISNKTAEGAAEEGEPLAGRSRTAISARRLTMFLLGNHVLWGIAIGFFLSLTKIGTKWLDRGPPPAVVNGMPVYKPNEDFVEGLGFIDLFLDYLGRCTTPAALFAMGLWISQQPLSVWFSGSETCSPCSTTPDTAAKTPKEVLWMLFFKFVLCPLLMTGLAKALDLDAMAARAAVLVAVIPISLASFTLAEQYHAGTALLTKLVVFGTVLLLPASILCLEALDGTDTFELPPPMVPPPS